VERARDPANLEGRGDITSFAEVLHDFAESVDKRKLKRRWWMDDT
jgi:hypothetical protein